MTKDKKPSNVYHSMIYHNYKNETSNKNLKGFLFNKKLNEKEIRIL